MGRVFFGFCEGSSAFFGARRGHWVTPCTSDGGIAKSSVWDA